MAALPPFLKEDNLMKLGLSMYSYYAAYRQGQIDIPNFIQEAKVLARTTSGAGISIFSGGPAKFARRRSSIPAAAVPISS